MRPDHWLANMPKAQLRLVAQLLLRGWEYREDGLYYRGKYAAGACIQDTEMWRATIEMARRLERSVRKTEQAS